MQREVFFSNYGGSFQGAVLTVAFSRAGELFASGGVDSEVGGF